ncbi:microtubule-associated protein Jupiter-like isoform X1 [Argonauta hians]
MTSTGIKQGYNENKPSSRVLKPPGGGASNIFGPDTKVEASSVSKVNRMESNVFKEPEAGNQPVASKKEDTHNNLFGEHKMAAKTDFKPAIMKGHGYFKDPINSTGQPADSEVMHTRISQPPGGHCHQLW